MNLTRYEVAIENLNSKYGWHLDAQKLIGKKMGKKCGGSYIAPYKRCRSHYTDGKLNEAGRASSRLLAKKVRAKKGMKTLGEVNRRINKPTPLLDKMKRSQSKQEAQSMAKDKTYREMFEEADRIGTKYQVSPQSTRTKRQPPKQKPLRQRPVSPMDNAPVRIANSRSSSEPRRRGRSVD